VVPRVRADLALQMDSPGPHTVDLSALALLTPAGVTFLEELLEEGDVRLCCAKDSPAYETLSALDLADRVEVAPLD
jgi:hypothetical protein